LRDDFKKMREFFLSSPKMEMEMKSLMHLMLGRVPNLPFFFFFSFFL
jgi:hypothetical protein